MNNKMNAQSALSSGSAANTQGSLGANAGVAAATVGGAVTPYRGGELAADLLRRMFGRYPGSVNLRLWNGEKLTVGAGSAGSALPFTLVFHDTAVVWSAVLEHDPLVLAESFFRGDLEIEGDFF